MAMNNKTVISQANVEKLKIQLAFQQDEFIRRVWIQLAKEKAPLELFAESLEEVVLLNHEVVVHQRTTDVTYQGSVGYDRQEPYVDYETYYEEEPYLTTESYYDQATKMRKERQVTKYKKVQRQRQVTKYKTVTDWSAISGVYQTQATVLMENARGLTLNENRFSAELLSAKADSIVALDAQRAEEVRITSDTEDALNVRQEAETYAQVSASLPGDRQRDISYTVTDINDVYQIYVAPEFQTKICYDGKEYCKRAFAFGNMEPEGDTIKNNMSPEAFEEEEMSKFYQRESKEKEERDNRIWKSLQPFAYTSLGLFLLSIIISCFVHVTVLVIIAFLIAVGFYVFYRFIDNEKTSVEGRIARDRIEVDSKEVDKKIKNYTSDYNEKIRQALDGKLKALGLKPVQDMELEVEE